MQKGRKGDTPKSDKRKPPDRETGGLWRAGVQSAISANAFRTCPSW